MKKATSLILALILMLSLSVTAFADGTTTLTTEVPSSSYTLSIPANQTISFANKSTTIGNVTATNTTGFGVGKDLSVSVQYDAFSCLGVSTTIPYKLRGYSGAWNKEAVGNLDILTGDTIIFKGQSDGTVKEKATITFEYAGSPKTDSLDGIYVIISSGDWGKALAGTYTSTITFTSEVVASETT